MYTMIWREKDEDRWDRFSSKKAVIQKLKEIRDTPEASPLGDVWVFCPPADDHAKTGEDFLG